MIATSFSRLAALSPVILLLTQFRMAGDCLDVPPGHMTPAPWELESSHSTDIWEKLKLPSAIRNVSGSGTAKPTAIDCSGGCVVNVVSNDVLLDQDGEDAIIRICASGYSVCRFVLLHKTTSHWNLVDYIDSPAEKYVAPVARVVPAGTRRWMVRRGYGGGGTGVALDVEDWFEVRCGRLVKVLSHSKWGFDVNAQPARYFSTRFLGFENTRNRESLVFAYTVRFDDYETQRHLWQEEKKVVFSRTQGDTTFVFDAHLSTIEQAFQENIFAFDSLEAADFIDYAHDQLLAIASNPSDRRWNWVRRFATSLPDSDRSRSPRSALKLQ